jgi:hypothetical protein
MEYAARPAIMNASKIKKIQLEAPNAEPGFRPGSKDEPGTEKVFGDESESWFDKASARKY